jgi:transcriptional regulator with XRE-family HTH domain
MKKDIEILLKKLNEYRLENKLTYKELCEELKVKYPGTVRSWLKGLKIPRDTNLYHIEKFLKQKGVIK